MADETRKLYDEIRRLEISVKENGHHNERVATMLQAHLKADENRDLKIDTRFDKIEEVLSIIRQKLFNGINEKVQKFDVIELRVNRIEDTIEQQCAVKKFQTGNKKHRLEILAGIAGASTVITGFFGVLSMLGVI